MKLMDTGKSILFLLTILLILIAAAIIVFIRINTNSVETSLSTDNILKVLFVIEADKKPVSTNIIAYYPETKKAAMFDIPENTGLILQSLSRTDGIGALYNEKGIDEFKKEIEKLTGISIPFYITCTVDEFVYLTDMLGCLSVFIPTPVDINNEQGRVLLPSGAVSLDGDKIKDYLLYTDELDGEGESAARKQKAVLALLRGINDHAPQIFQKKQVKLLHSNLHSNATDDNLKTLLEILCKLDSERLIPQKITGAIKQVDNKELLFPFRDGLQLKEIIRQALSVLASEEGASLERVYAVEILNGTDIKGLAKGAGEIYQSFGYDVVQIGNAESSNNKETVLIDRIGNPRIAKIVGQVIQCKNIQTTQVPESNDYSGMEAGVDFTLILGSDFNGYFVKPKPRDTEKNKDTKEGN